MRNPFVTAIWLNAIIFLTFAQKASSFDDWSDWHKWFWLALMALSAYTLGTSYYDWKRLYRGVTTKGAIIGPSGVFLARSTYDDTNKNVTKN